MPKNKQPLTAQQELFIRLSAQGKTRPEVLREVFHIEPSEMTKEELAKYDMRMTRWRKRPEFETIWKDEVRSILFGCTAKAIQVINSQMDEDIPWLRNKAANDLMNYGKSQLYGDEEKAVHVKIEGMPDIGSPDD
ncbi:MAG: hypothetical protein J6U30_05875 [Oscillospiraceae bacterium]|nr:hypothetical protein [Oscillospiraceae bacterium]